MQNSPNKFLFQFIGNFNGVLLINELTRNEKKTKKTLVGWFCVLGRQSHLLAGRFERKVIIKKHQ